MASPPDTYTHGHHESVLRSHRWRTAANSAAYLLPHLRAGMALLDVGCGPGTITKDLAALVAPGTVLGIDREPAVVALAEADVAQQQPSERSLSFAVGDVYGLVQRDRSFDVVHAHQVLQHLSDPVRAMVEMRRVCRRDGLVACRDSDYSGFTWYPHDELLDRWLDVYRQVARSNNAEPDAGRRLMAWAQQARFSEVVASASVWCFATPADRDWWGGLWAERVTQSALHDQAVERHIASHDELLAIAAAFRRWAAEPDGWFAVLHGEVLCKP